MTLSKRTGGTVADVDQALDDAGADYRNRLADIKRQFLLPAQETISRLNAAARQRFAEKRKTLNAYRAALVAETAEEADDAE